MNVILKYILKSLPTDQDGFIRQSNALDFYLLLLPLLFPFIQGFTVLTNYKTRFFNLDVYWFFTTRLHLSNKRHAISPFKAAQCTLHRLALCFISPFATHATLTWRSVPRGCLDLSRAVLYVKKSASILIVISWILLSRNGIWHITFVFF